MPAVLNMPQRPVTLSTFEANNKVNKMGGLYAGDGFLQHVQLSAFAGNCRKQH